MQKGVHIDIINAIKENYSEWNHYSRSPFSEMNGISIARAIDERQLEEIKPFDESEPVGWMKHQSQKHPRQSQCFTT